MFTNCVFQGGINREKKTVFFHKSDKMFRTSRRWSLLVKEKTKQHSCERGSAPKQGRVHIFRFWQPQHKNSCLGASPGPDVPVKEKIPLSLSLLNLFGRARDGNTGQFCSHLKSLSHSVVSTLFLSVVLLKDPAKKKEQADRQNLINFLLLEDLV
jgi:hypothetical protein